MTAARVHGTVELKARWQEVGGNVREPAFFENQQEHEMKLETMIERAHIAAQNARAIADEERNSDCYEWAEGARRAAERADACDESEHEYIAKLSRFAKACEDICVATVGRVSYTPAVMEI